MANSFEKKISKKLTAFLLLFACAVATNGQYAMPYFNQLTVISGLPEARVQSSLQDRQGYIWMGTQNGLARYDGYEIKVYKMPDDNGEPLNFCSVSDLHEDEDGTLWVYARLEGEYYYDRQNDVFKKIIYFSGRNKWFPAYHNFLKAYSRDGLHVMADFDDEDKFYHTDVLDSAHRSFERFSPLGKGRLFNPSCHTEGVMKDIKGNIWVSADSLLSLYDPVKKAFIPYFTIPSKESNLFFNDIYTDPANPGILWLTTITKNHLPGFVIQLSVKNKTFKIFLNNRDSTTSLEHGCTGIFTDSLKRLWFATVKGILQFNRQTGIFAAYKLSYSGMPAGFAFYIRCVAAGNDGSVWIGGNFPVLFCINTKTGSILDYRHVEGQSGTLPSLRQGANGIFFDKTGILWVELPVNGMAYINPKNSFFNRLAVLPPEKRYNSDTKPFNCVAGIKDDSTLFTSGTAGLFAWRYRQNLFDRINLGDTDAESAAEFVFKDKEGLFWVSHYRKGLFCYNPVTKKTINYPESGKDNSSLGNSYARCITEAPDGTIWVGTFGAGICSFNRQSGKFRHYPFIRNNSTNAKVDNMLDDDEALSMVFDHEGILWIGTNNGGINRLDVKTGKFTSFHNREEGLELITSLYEDSKGRLWAGSYLSGLFVFNRKTYAYKKYTERDGLAYNGVNDHGIAEDKNGNIWVSSVRGMSVIDLKSDEITVIGGLFKAADLSRNIPKNLLQGTGGLFYQVIGTNVSIFSPAALTKNTVPPAVVIESIKYHAEGTPVSSRDTTLFAYKRQKTALHYDENRLVFDYTALHFADPLQNRYTYILQGYDKTWVQAGANRQATYTNLPPGHYTFKVKACNSDGVWNEDGASLAVVILPPWWQTWWAYIFYILAAGAFMWGFAYYRSKKLRNDNRVLERKIKTRTTEVLEQKEEMAAQRDELEQKNIELEIEAALEKVRSRSLSMLKPGGLEEVAKLVFEKLRELGVYAESKTESIMLFEGGSREFEQWVSVPGKSAIKSFKINYMGRAVQNKFFDAWESGAGFFAQSFPVEEKESCLQQLFGQTGFEHLPTAFKNAALQAHGCAITVAMGKYSGICITSLTEKLLAEKENDILKRFAKVFEQAYVRFLDLQKAEAQSKETQIELGLEKVRVRAMAMQDSGELSHLVVFLLNELTKLDFELTQCLIYTMDETASGYTIWVAAAGYQHAASSYYIKLINHPFPNALMQAWKERKPKWLYDLKGIEKKTYQHYLFNETACREAPEELKVATQATENVFLSFSFSNFGGLQTAGLKPLSDANLDILCRFGKVFDLTYTRFLDLKKAEMQAREAAIRASADKLRAEIASMRTSADLERITPVIWQELTGLKVPFTRCGVFIMNEQQRQAHVYLSNPGGTALASFQLSFDANTLLQNLLACWKSGQTLTLNWEEAMFSSWAKGLVGQEPVQPDGKYIKEKPDGNLCLYFMPFMQGMLYAGNASPLSERDINLLQVLADAFAAAYARYEDFNKLEASKQQVDKTLTELKAAQHQLIQAEKMASLGELTAGIAHEIQNPLNFVNNFSEVSIELLDELKEEEKKGNKEDVMAIAGDLSENLKKITYHGKRADAIVKGMLQHSRKNTGQKELTDINALADEYLRLSYHGLRAKDKGFNAEMRINFDYRIGKIGIVPQDIGRVLLNLYNNAFYAVDEKNKTAGNGYKPAITVTTKKDSGRILITVGDNGNGIPEKIKDKIFQPFFTTKPTGQGTGLGLSLSYDIVKAHGGELKVKTVEGEGTEFIVIFPVV